MDFKAVAHAAFEQGNGGDEVSEKQMEALLTLEQMAQKDELRGEHAAIIRLQGFIPSLLATCTGANKAARHAALLLCSKCAYKDINFCAAVLKDGVVRKFVKLSEWNPDKTEEEMEDTVLALWSLNRSTWPDIPNTGFASPADDLFRFGYMARISRILEAPTKFAPLMHIACKLVCTVSDVKSCRERLRDLGIIPRVIQMIHEGTEVDMNVCTLANLSRSDSLHSTLRDVGMLDAMLKAVEVVKEDDSELTQVLFAVANVYAGSERQGGPANKLLSSYDVSLAVAARLDAVVRGSGYVHGTVVSLEEAAHGANALSCSPVLASHMCKAGVVELLVEVLQGRAEDANAVLYTCRALLNLCGLSFLHATLLKAGVPDAIKKFADHPDVRIQDTAKGCLLQLGQLEDQKAQAANSLLEQGAGEPGEFTYDVFLSHKRSDAKDFARALYNLFVLRGVTTFLDFEYREELQLEGGLEKLVQSCRNFVFVLTDNVLDSHWCMQELAAAVRSQRNIILVVKEGSRWPDEDGKKTLPFPGTHLLGNLDPSLKAVFMKKAIHHSDEYYSSFIDMLMKKVTANQPAASQSTAGQQQADGSSPGVQHGTNEAPLVPTQHTAGTLTAISAPTQNSSAPAFASLAPVGPQAFPSAATAAAAPAPIISSPMQPQLMPVIPTHPSQGQSLPAGVMVSDPRPTFQNSGAVEMLLQLGQVERMLMGMVAEVRRDMSALAFELPRAQADTQRQLQQMQVEMQRQMQAEVQRQVQAEVQWHVQTQVQRAQEGLRQQVFEVQRMGMQMKAFLQQQQQQQLQQQLQQQQQQQQQQRQQACSAPFAFSRPQPRIPAFPPLAPQVPLPSLGNGHLIGASSGAVIGPQPEMPHEGMLSASCSSSSQPASAFHCFQHGSIVPPKPPQQQWGQQHAQPEVGGGGNRMAGCGYTQMPLPLHKNASNGKLPPISRTQ